LKQAAEQQQFENQRALTTEGLNERKFGESTRQFDAGHGENVRQFDATLGNTKQQWADLAPQRAATLEHTGAQTWDIKRKPEVEAADRTHDTGMENLRGTWNLRQIGASGAEQRKTQAVQHGFERSQSGPGGKVNLGAAAQADLADMMTLEDMANSAVKLGDEIGWEGVGGMGAGSRGQFMQKHFGRGNPQSETLRNTLGNLTATIAKLRGGTSFTANEQALLEKYAPTDNEHPTAIKAKLAGLAQFIQTKRKNVLAVASGDFSGGRPSAQINTGQMGQIDTDPLGLFGGKK
jgi:hypothetical protein